VTFKSHVDGVTLHGRLLSPRNLSPGKKYPAVLGPVYSNTVRNHWDERFAALQQYMAMEGEYFVLQVDVRGSVGYGREFLSKLVGNVGDIDVEDLVSGVQYLETLPQVDPDRVGIWGWSYGGYMACLALLRAGDTFQAGFAGAPVTDWRYYDTIYTERYMGLPKDNPDGYTESSPVSYADGLRGKLLIAHASGDDNVHFGNTLALADAFVDAQKYAEFLLYAGRGHGITDAPARIHIFNRVTQFFLENLMAQPAK
jgi:dipeptidyl-peptidase-4